MRARLLTGVAFVLVAGLPVAAAAQAPDAAAQTSVDAPAPSPQDGVASAADNAGGDIIVTAQKRSERLLDVPMSISAVTGDALESSGITSTVELRQSTPGLVTVNTGFGFVPIIRGIQSSGTSPGDASNVAIYLDDVSVGAPIAGFFDLADIERVEVLKGPQGTLFGRNATGGAIRIVTRKPSFTLNGNIGVDYGFRYDEVRVTGYLSGPISQTLAASVSTTVRKGDGFIKGIGPNEGQDYGGADNYLVRGKLLYQPSDGIQAIVSADKWQQQNNSVFISMIDEGENPYPGPTSVYSGKYTYAGRTQPRADLEGWGATGDVTVDISDLTLRSITGYREVKVRSQSDTDRTSESLSWNAISQYEHSFSEELNLSSAANKPLTWILGGYYFNAKAGNPFFRQGSGDAPPGVIVTSFTNRVNVTAYAGFGEATLNLFDDRLHLTGGIRYNSETKEFHYRDQIKPAPPLRVTDTEKTWDSVTYRGVARFDLADNANVYASISNGFKSGVYNAYSFLDNPVDPEKVTAYEIGAKARVRGITLTAAGYAYDYKDIQLSAYVTIDGQLLVTLTNAANARMRGLEFTAEGRIAEGLSFLAGVSWEPTKKYVNYTTAQVVVPIPDAVGPINKQVIVPYNASGSNTVRTPETTANLRLNYERPLWGGNLNATVSGTYTSSFFWQPGNFSREDPSFVSNARISWTDGKRGLTYSVFGTNLTDSTYHTDFVANTRGGDSVKFPPRRQIGVGVNWAF